MFIPFLIAKIHSARVTDANPDYAGSISIDGAIMKQAGLREFQKVEVYNITNGNRLATYTMAAESGSREFILNGAAAHLVNIGDKIIVAAYALLDERELNSRSVTILLMNDKNEVERIIGGKL
jgi:aspartate 1-decarboxylase